MERIGHAGVHEIEHITNPNARHRVVGVERAGKQAINRQTQSIRETVRPVKTLSIKELELQSPWR